MKTIVHWLWVGVLIWGGCFAQGATERFVSPSGGNMPPYTDWASAATNIQDAIDVSSATDVIWVTNGVYSSGGKVLSGDLTNRVALDRPILVQSINGPAVTIIDGASLTNGSAAVRCAWLTNGAVLSGFTLQRGGTRISSSTPLGSGGGVWCAATNGIVTNCLVCSNWAYNSGGGAYGATLNNCRIVGNTSPPPIGSGGGVFQSLVNNSWLCANTAYYGSGAYSSTLNSSTVVSNIGSYGALASKLTNCIVYYHTNGNFSSCTLAYCCTIPAVSGPGNFTNAPRLAPDGLHLDNGSPCRNAGTNLVFGMDLEGQSWANPPSIGCSEWQAAPRIAGIPVNNVLLGQPLGFTLTGYVTGQSPITCWWLKDGNRLQDDAHYSSTQTTNLVVAGVDLLAATGYQLVASNTYGMVTSAVAGLAVHCVNVAGTSPMAPYSAWATAATNIQDAINGASRGDLVWVTNGTYSQGGKAVSGYLTNRVVVDKALTLLSVNGPAATFIEGAGTLSGNSGVRCAWMADGAVMSGFTLERGATSGSTDPAAGAGGGAYCATTNTVLTNCIVRSNTAYCGGGVYSGTVNNCWIIGNSNITFGGGVYQSVVNNSLLKGNIGSTGAAAFNAVLNQCTIISNTVAGATYGVSECKLTNCLLYFNTNASASRNYDSSCLLAYSCTTPLPAGPGNITNNPQLWSDGMHLSNLSPCRGAGLGTGFGTDLDGLTWSNPPSMGCFEWRPEPPVIASAKAGFGVDSGGVAFNVAMAWKEPVICYWLKDGVPVNDDGHFSSSNTSTLSIKNVNLSDAGAYQVVVSNAYGMSTSAVMQVVIHCVDPCGTAPVAPYLSWSSAATNIQNAIDAAMDGEIILVTNGLYASGSRTMSDGTPNRVAVTKAVLVQSINGPGVTVIQGTWDAATNGPGAVRCAWLTNNAVLSGFTLRGGATSSGYTTDQYKGGGVLGITNSAVVVGCVITNNSAYFAGGGANRVTLNACLVVGNFVPNQYQFGEFDPNYSGGGGAADCVLNNSTISGNVVGQFSSFISFINAYGGGLIRCMARNCLVLGNTCQGEWNTAGGGVYGGSLINCTVVSNIVETRSWGYGAGTSDSALTNCIVLDNMMNASPGSGTNYDTTSTLSYCCSWPLPPGIGNISADPQLLADASHLAAASSCRGAGLTTVVSGTDLDGQPWANPPSIGCDEWYPQPVIICQPQSLVMGTPPQLQIGKVTAAGQEPFSYYWFKDASSLENSSHYGSTHTTNLMVCGFGPADAGNYYLVASNVYGMATSAVASVVVHCADPNGVAPAAPYLTWATAATNLQDAVDAAGAGEFVLAANGIYATGGRVMYGDLTNRVAINQPLTVSSMNGPEVTIIQGARDPSATNGPGAVRCAWLTNFAQLCGFTLQGGATRAAGSSYYLQNGGGVFGYAGGALVTNCVIRDNAANGQGGGAANAMLAACKVINNQAPMGGGIYHSSIFNCLIQSNCASQSGGGVYNESYPASYRWLIAEGCTITGNWAPVAGGYYMNMMGIPMQTAPLINCIVYGNHISGHPELLSELSGINSCSNSCISTLPQYASNSTSADPQLLNDGHLAVTSPCRGMGNGAWTSGTDIDGEAWAATPSIGCDEVWESALTGPLSVGVTAGATVVTERGNLILSGLLNGRATRVAWDFGDGASLTAASSMNPVHAWAKAGDYTVTFTAFNQDHPAGVSASTSVHVIALVNPSLISSQLSGTNFTLTFSAQPGVVYYIDQTANLVPPVVWTPVATNWLAAGGLAQVTDPSATNAARFYRIRIQ